MAGFVERYRLALYGQAGVGGNRASLQLSGPNGQPVHGWIDFKDSGVALGNDENSGGFIRMKLPVALLPAVIDFLRNEKPIIFYYTNGHAELVSSEEFVGEDDT